MRRGKVQAFVRAGCVTALALGTAERDALALDPSKSLSQYVAQTWQQSDDGLPQNFVSSIAQTKDGYLWLATQEGVVRFDGARFVVFSTRDVAALRTNDVDVMIADRAGGLWIGTRGGGLTRYADGAFTTYLQKDGLGYDVIVDLFEARDGSLWIATRGGGVSRFKDGRFTTFRATQGLANDTVWAIAELPDGTLWFGTDAGLSRYDGVAFTTVRDGLSDPAIRSLLADGDGTLWIGTRSGLDRLANGALTGLREADGLGAGAVDSLLRDREGNLWIGMQAGIRRLAAPGGTGTPTPLGNLSTLDGDGVRRFEGVRALKEDREGNLWIGMESKGLLRLKDGKVTSFGLERGMASDLIWTTFEDQQGTLWAGTNSGLFEMRGDGFVRATAQGPHGADLTIDSMTQTRDGALWLGLLEHGVFTYANGAYARVDLAGALPSKTVRTIHQDTRGTVWLGTNRGLVSVDAAGPRRLGLADGIPQAAVVAAVNDIVEGGDGSLWIGTDLGLLQRKEGAFTLRTTKDGMSNDTVQSLYVDGSDLWIGTYGGGIDLLRGGKMGRVTTRNGLFNDVVYAIVDDAMGSLWMTCNKGIFHASKAELAEVAMGGRATLVTTALGTSDGMRSSECNSGVPGGVRAHDGRLWFPTAAGAVRVDPAHMRKNTVVPPVLIEEVQVNRARVDLARDASLPPGSQDFQFDYTALSFTAPERVRFRYRLDGFDKDWVDAGARRVAYYTNLAPGRYRFRVIAANDDGVWNDEGAAVGFSLEPRFYQTLPFYLACAFGLMLVGAGSVRLRLVALRDRARELERKVDLRTQQLAKANEDLQGAFRALAEKDARLHEDLLQAQAFQQRILPRLPTGGLIGFRALYKPADLVGGDVYDVCEIGAQGDGGYRVFVADTTGHGVQASLRTMVLKTEYDRLKLAPEGPGHVLAELNRKIASVYPGLEMRCSACCFDVIPDGEGGARVRYANAAHPPLLRVTKGRVDEVYASGTFLGMVHEVAFREAEVRLDPGDLLLAYTDGICEQENGEGSAFGVERMEELLSERTLDAQTAIAKLDGAMTAFAQGRPLDDDVVLVCVEVSSDRASREIVR